ncbi:DUF4031 domain-containing protein [Acetobacteraceae bacterium H6797]|nr:DUF4031 domain-containing protein [Acetobacteraceae bacterium H6797]
MTVYVDDMHRSALGAFKGMRMSHMIADDEAELHAMADAIGMPRRSYQGNHYDVPLERRAMAVALGAVQVSMKQMAGMVVRQRETGQLGPPGEAEAWARAYWRGRLRRMG